MSSENRNFALDLVFQWEGGFVDHPQDPGGATNMGITQRTLSEYLGRDATRTEVETLSQETAEAIYIERYWGAVWGDELPGGLDVMMFDTAVNMGVYRAVTLLQEIVDTKTDGIMGPITLSATRELWADNSASLLQDYAARRAVAYGNMSHFSTFGWGWMRRLMETFQTAEMIRFCDSPHGETILRFKARFSA